MLAVQFAVVGSHCGNRRADMEGAGVPVQPIAKRSDCGRGAMACGMLPGGAGQDVQEAVLGAVVRREHCPVDASADQDAGRLRQLRRPGRMAAVGMNAEPRS